MPTFIFSSFTFAITPARWAAGTHHGLWGATAQEVARCHALRPVQVVAAPYDQLPEADGIPRIAYGPFAEPVPVRPDHTPQELAIARVLALPQVTAAAVPAGSPQDVHRWSSAPRVRP